MYYVRYVRGCTPHIKGFMRKKDATKFVANFMLKYQFKNTDDNWIESVVKGKIVYLEPAVKVNNEG